MTDPPPAANPDKMLHFDTVAALLEGNVGAGAACVRWDTRMICPGRSTSGAPAQAISLLKPDPWGDSDLRKNAVNGLWRLIRAGHKSQGRRLRKLSGEERWAPPPPPLC